MRNQPDHHRHIPGATLRSSLCTYVREMLTFCGPPAPIGGRAHVFSPIAARSKDNAHSMGSSQRSGVLRPHRSSWAECAHGLEYLSTSRCGLWGLGCVRSSWAHTHNTGLHCLPRHNLTRCVCVFSVARVPGCEKARREQIPDV